MLAGGLSKREVNYPEHKLRVLALKWGVTEKFADYLQGQQCTVYTDNNPLTYVTTTAKLGATGQQWLAALVHFNFYLKYKPGINNQDADGLSQCPYGAPYHYHEFQEYDDKVGDMLGRLKRFGKPPCHLQFFLLPSWFNSHYVPTQIMWISMVSPFPLLSKW